MEEVGSQCPQEMNISAGGERLKSLALIIRHALLGHRDSTSYKYDKRSKFALWMPYSRPGIHTNPCHQLDGGVLLPSHNNNKHVFNRFHTTFALSLVSVEAFIRKTPPKSDIFVTTGPENKSI